jgi:hypothetical protein
LCFFNGQYPSIGGHYEIKDGVAVKYIFAGGMRLAVASGSGVNYFHKDHLGSSTLMTDATGSVIETTDYLPFGGQRNHSGNEFTNYKFTDQEYDTSSERIKGTSAI